MIKNDKTDNEQSTRTDEAVNQLTGHDSANTHDTARRHLAKRSRFTGKKWLIALVVIVLFAAAIGAIFWFTTKTPEQQPSGQEVVDAQPYELHLSDILEKTKGESVVATKVTSLGGHSSEDVLIYDFAPYQVEGTVFQSLPTTGEGLSMEYPDAPSAEQAKEVAVEVLTDAGFTLVSDKTSDAGGLSSQNYATIASYSIYKSKDTVCSLAHLTSKEAPVGHGIAAGCADISKYEASAKSIKPFHDAFVRSNQASALYVMSAPAIKKSANGAERAIVQQKPSAQSVAGNIALYYRISASNDWQYLTTAVNGRVPCSVFATTEQKAAFKGYGCYDEAQRKFISLGA